MLGYLCMRERKSAAVFVFPGICLRRFSKDKTLSRQFHRDRCMLFDCKNCVDFLLSVKTRTGFVAPEMKRPKWSKEKHRARNSL